ncbi:vanadium-dependent haloperoxidase [Synechococcus sp. CC9311]|uniref:vanadium-dependent haloperoxidase n=1 Tax=Synechococcus sp. (strain CC9311) TaxID=64471 RepID=UPI0000DDAA17|nr:vanadium-dependent haloperoxidase [Synechococcus sp. CC9311]ABI45999.1 hypothetical protein sync_0262 [Synechococcus sp. CC9311]
MLFSILFKGKLGNVYNSFLYSFWGKKSSASPYDKTSLGDNRDEPEFDLVSSIDEKAKLALTVFSGDIKIAPNGLELNNDIELQSTGLELNSDTEFKPTSLELSNDIELQSNGLELSNDIELQSNGLELSNDIELQSNGLELSNDIELQSNGLELNSDIKLKSVDFFPESQFVSDGNEINVTLESSTQISGINALPTTFKIQSETGTPRANSSLISFADSSSQNFSAKSLLAPWLDLIKEPVVNSGSFQDAFSSVGNFNSLIKNILQLNPSSLKIQPLENLAGVFDTADHLLAWNTLALDFATASVSGPTPCSRFFGYLNISQWDSWAVFEDTAIGSIYNKEKQASFISLLDSFEISSNDLAEFKCLYQASTKIVQEILEHAVRQVAMDVSAFNVVSGIETSLFKEGIPESLVGAAQKLLAKNLDLSELGKKIGDLVVSIGTNIGETVSSSINQYALGDGSNQLGFYADTTDYIPSPSVYDPNDPNTKIDSSWQPLEGQSALTPQWGAVTPFAIEPDNLIPSSSIVTPYTELGELNSDFIDELMNVRDKRLNLTAEEAAIAEYYEGGPFTSFPPGLWQQQSVDLSISRNLDLDQALKLNLGVSLALSDAGIATWNLKYSANTVRPITAIRQYKPDTVLSDGSLAGDWEPYLDTPPFPDIASGHSAFSSSANYIFNQSFESNYFDFSVTLADDDSVYSVDGFDGIPGVGDDVTIQAVYFTGAAAQAGDSRIYGGIHLKDGDLKGQIIGYITGLKVSRKIDSLEQGISLEELSSLPVQSFGTMKSDILTGLSMEDFDEISVHQLYAFDGDDTLIAKGESLWQLYGGSGMDTFQLFETGSVSLRDYERMEEIELASTIFQQGESIDDIQFTISATGPFTDVSINDRLLFVMDGYWISDDVSVSILA